MSFETGFIPRHITPIARGVTLEEKLIDSCRYRDAGAIAQVIVQAMMADPLLKLSAIEAIFRAQTKAPQGWTYLLAAPQRIISHKGAISVDFRDGSPKPYHLWVCVNGPVEAEDTMKHFGLTSVEMNLRLLDNETGFLADKL